MNRTPFFIAGRLSLSTGGRYFSPSVVLSITAVALSLSVMLAAVCIVTGFKKEITAGVAGFNSHITLLPASADSDGRYIVTLSRHLDKILADNAHITDYSPETSMPAVFKTPEQFKGIYLRGIGAGQDSAFLSSKLIRGRLPVFSGNKGEILISENAASDLEVAPGDTIDTFFMGSDVRMRRYVLSGTYRSHFEYDNNYAYLPLITANEVVGLPPDEFTDIRIMTSDLRRADSTAAELNRTLASAYASRLTPHYRVVSTLSAASGYFSWLSLLDTNVVVIIILMTAVAAMTLISAMLIMIGEKSRIIGILRALGAPESTIRRIFIILATRVCLRGLVIGNAVTLTFLILEEKYHFVHLDPEAYYIDFMPVSITPWFVILLNLGVAVSVFMLLLLPARSAAKGAPSGTMLRN